MIIAVTDKFNANSKMNIDKNDDGAEAAISDPGSPRY